MGLSYWLQLAAAAAATKPWQRDNHKRDLLRPQICMVIGHDHLTRALYVKSQKSPPECWAAWAVLSPQI
jgi:hypothetical protein